MTTTCPPWSADDDEHSSPACFTKIRGIVQRAASDAQKRVPRRGDLAAWHREAFRAVVPLDYYAGGFRQDDPRRPCLACNVAVGGAKGFDYRVVLGAVEELCGFVAQELGHLELGWQALRLDERQQRIATVVGVAIGRFVHIHPFRNGNGRISRMFWTVLLARLGLPRQLSVLRRPGPPYGNVMEAAMAGNYAPAVAMVLRALAAGPMPPPTLPAPAS